MSYFAVYASLFFFGVCFVMSLVGGWLADSILGRFKAILLSFIIYITGYSLMPVLSSSSEPEISRQDNATLPAVCGLPNYSVRQNVPGIGNATNDNNPFDEPCAWLIYIALTIIAVGTGFVKASIAPFGCDQVARGGQQVTLSFFNWFYWAVNMGALIGLTVITYVQQQHSFFYGYLSAVICLGLALLLFAIGRCFFVVRPPDGSVLANIFRIIREAWRRKRQRGHARHVAARNLDGHRIDEADPSEARLSFLDYAKHRHGGCFHDALVDDVKELKKVICVFAVLIPYWLVYFQMETTFLIQGLHMRMIWAKNPRNTSVSATKNATAVHEADQFKLVAAWFSVFDVVALILLLPLFDRIIYPWLERRGHPMGVSKRIFLGMVFAILAMIVAGVVEYYRLKAYWPDPHKPCQDSGVSQTIGGSIYYAADMSILYQIPQYILIGVSEVFTSVAGLQFAVSVAPKSMKGIIMGLFYMFSGIGSFLGSGIINVLSSTNTWFHSFDSGNINCRDCKDKSDQNPSYYCHLDYYFYLLAGIELFGALLFLLVAHIYHLDQLRGDGVVSHPLGDGSEDFLRTPRRTSRSLPHSIQRNMSDDLSS